MNKLKIVLSRDSTGLIIALIGVLIQGFHTYFVAFNVSSIQHNIFTPIYAVSLSIFVSSGLVFFALRAGITEDQVEKMKYENISLNFRWFETFINLYYTLRRLIYIPITTDKSWSELNYFDIIMGIVFSFGIPYILSLYSGQINFDKKKEFSKGEEIDLKLIEGNKEKRRFKFKVL